MARVKKKGQSGQAKNYITRTQAVKKLQISLPDFRKLCIWKGIYPREPRSRKKASKSSTASTTFYYAKDIQYLLHEPLLQKFREQKILEKKISRALGRGEASDAARLERNASRPELTGRPRYTLDHVVRERFPTFADALRDLDDCLSMLFLFAQLPATAAVPARMIARCERLTLEFQHYLIVARALRRSFLSIKGIYYQAEIQGQEVLWLVPYKFNQRVVGDVDFRIMGTFVEFYMTLLGFVNYRLYTSIGLKYPPRFDQAKDNLAAELGAFSLEGVNFMAKNGGDSGDAKAILNGEEAVAQGPDPNVQEEVNKLVRQLKATEETGDLEPASDEPATEEAVAEEEDKPSGGLDKFEPVAPGGDIVPQPELGSAEAGNLFSKFTFYLSRESPRQPLEFLLRAFGCKRIGWDAVLGDGAYTTNESDPAITHQIVDRPVIKATVAAGGDGEDNQTAQKLGPNRRHAGRVYVQPQWVWDSVNDEELKSPDLYAPGAQLPPHLSPFVKHVPGQYDPTLALDEQEPEAEALEAAVEDEDAMVEDNTDEEGLEGMDVASDTDEGEHEVDDFGGFSEHEDAGQNDDDDGNEEEQGSSEDDQEAKSRQLELEAEFSGKTVVAATNGSKKKKKQAAKASANGTGRPGESSKAEARRKELARQARAEVEEVERAKGMLSKKKRKLFEQMQYTNSKKKAEDVRLRAKRRKIEKESGQTGARGRGKKAVA